ncbi:MAG: hypothetical protein LAO76_01880 [Acidobacteriia bacterium]|nr:hypothetical protein [Terriglobia bacterium]
MALLLVLARYAGIPGRSLPELLDKIVMVLGLNFVLIVPATVPIAIALMVAVSVSLALHFALPLAISIASPVSIAFAFSLAIPVSISIAVPISFMISVAMAYGVSAVFGLCSDGKTSNGAAADGENYNPDKLP